MDEEELKKRFTDCVYFLASPLTCKKGIECDYRHSEIARLNPRDCWYWLGGCCYNSDCAFRHPPLEGLKEAYHESLNPNNGPTLPVDKTNIPCYFYSKGFCNKADRCSFLHEPADCNKSTVNYHVPCEKKLSTGSNTGSTPVQIEHIHPDPSDTAQIENTHMVRKHALDFHQLASRSESVESEEFVQSEENVFQTESDVYNNQSSDDYVEHKRWLDLSPGFDVIVEGESERLDYEENDVEFFSVNDVEHKELDYHYSEYDRLDKNYGQSRVSIFSRLSFKKRSLHRDLRDHVKKCKVVDFDHRIRRNFRPRGFRGEVDFDCTGWLKKAVQVNRYRPPLKKPRIRKPAQQHKRRSHEESAVFSGPKTLDQIKEEKTKSRETRDLGSVNRTESDDFFQGPRPLSEILKNKRKTG